MMMQRKEGDLLNRFPSMPGPRMLTSECFPDLLMEEELEVPAHGVGRNPQLESDGNSVL